MESTCICVTSEIVKGYEVRVHGIPTKTEAVRLKHGIELEDGPARFETVEASGGDGSNRWFKVALREGRNREVRRLWEAVGVEVSRLIRTGYGSLDLPRNMRRGEHVALMPAQARSLSVAAGLETAMARKRHKNQCN